MDHIVYLDFKTRELALIRAGKKTMIIRGAMGRKMPYGRVDKGDVLYFIENNGEGLVKGKAVVDDVFHSEKLTGSQSAEIVRKNQAKLLLNKTPENRFAGKRYLILIEIKDFEETESFKIDRSDYGNMDDWLPVGRVENVRLNS